MLIPIILSGGMGSRLWPLSREHYPKQLLNLHDNYSLLQNTVKRLNHLGEAAAPVVICNESHRFLVAEQLESIGIAPAAIILEPSGRNTAPATAIAALYAMEKNKDALILVLPADHLIQDTESFHHVLNQASEVAKSGRLVTFGIVPQTPETGYGYIRAGGSLAPQNGFQIAEFIEKPDRETAQHYLESEEYYWNSGMFLFKASQYLDELEEHAGDIHKACLHAFNKLSIDVERGFQRLDKDSFERCRSDSIDYAVMEKTQHGAILPLDAGWNDIGSWSALWEVGEKNAEGNVQNGDVIVNKSKNCYLRAEHRLLAAIGLEDMVVIETVDAVLVAHKDAVQDVKQVVSQLKQTRRGEADLHRRVHRPWGTYETIDDEPRFKVKRITVNPGASLSLQMHYHRSEHWIVVKGTAKITRGDSEEILTENQSTYIPVGVRHRLENPGKLALELIEVQSGGYLEEDDIVRFEDTYGREQM